MKMEETIVDRRTTDHDLLVTMHEQLKQVRIDISNLSDGTGQKSLDHEMRIRRLESWGAIAIGLLYALQFYYNFLKK